MDKIKAELLANPGHLKMATLVEWLVIQLTRCTDMQASKILEVDQAVISSAQQTVEQVKSLVAAAAAYQMIINHQGASAADRAMPVGKMREAFCKEPYRMAEVG